MIDKFRCQHKNTIWKFLAGMAKNKHTYSAHVDNIAPKLQGLPTYIYANSRNIVVLCMDHFQGHDELADEESFGDGDPLYFTGSSHRTSPVWRLSESIKLLQQRLRQQECPMPQMWGVLLTSSNILNADDMEEIWEDMQVKVIDQLCNLPLYKLPVNFNPQLPGKALVDALFNATEAKQQVAKNESDDIDPQFEHILQEFIEREYEQLHPDEEKAYSNWGKEDDEEDNEKDESNKEEEDDGPDDLDLPSGEIEQNDHTTVKAEILHPIAHPRDELNKLVGCRDIKERIDELLSLTRYNQLMHQLSPESKQHEVSLHSVFFGRPGTGKTTVCKIYGSLLREAGALSKGHVVVANRSTFIGSLWGDEERSVNQVVQMAKGGVLMIDEAYLLGNSKNENDPGKLVIQLLMDILSDEKHRDIAVVLCGYKEPMMRLLELNPGLHSRFPNRFEFCDFTVDELLEITLRRINEYGYHFTRSAWEKYKQVLTEAYQVRDPDTWGNARFIANQLERIYIQHATRCVRHQPMDRQHMLMLTPSDILPIETPRQKPRIGF